MIYGFGNTIEEEADADTAREEHEEPGDVVVFGLVIILAQFDVGILGKVEPDEEDCPNILRADVQPRENVRHPFLEEDEKERVGEDWWWFERKVMCVMSKNASLAYCFGIISK